MSDLDTQDELYIAGLGSFQAQREKSFLGLYCFSKNHPFHGQTVELIVYPNEDGTWPSEIQRIELTSRFKQLEAKVVSALQALPSHLAPLCKEYQIDIDHLTSTQITDGINWHNVKLEPSGEIECYTMNEEVTSSLDIAIRFTSEIIISDVHFDG